MQRVVESLRAVLRVLYYHLPKGRYAVLWGWPDYEDSILALEQELRQTDLRRVFLLMTDRRSPPPAPLGPKTVRVTKDSFAGWVVFLLSSHVFFTHRCFMRRFPPNVVSVNVWHGMPIKRVGWMLDGDEGIESQYVLATSPFWAEIMERAMRPSGPVLVTGLPRNDRLFLDPAPVDAALGPDAEASNHLLVWLPTYRRSVRGLLTVDGTPTDSPFEFDVDPEELNRYLAAHHAYAVVKPHPMAAFTGEQRWSNLLVVDDSWLRRHRLSLYQVLGAADVLISDVSSVTIDYLLVDRPVVHAIADLDEYRASRGFSVERVEELLAGPVATSWAELAAHLDEALDGADPEADRRRRVRTLSHTDTDAGATRRLLGAVGLPGR